MGHSCLAAHLSAGGADQPRHRPRMLLSEASSGTFLTSLLHFNPSVLRSNVGASSGPEGVVSQYLWMEIV